MNKYEFCFKATCPNDGKLIDYALEISTHADAMIQVECIRVACADISAGYHEEIADRLAATFGGRQVLRATHQGVTITTVRGAM